MDALDLPLVDALDLPLVDQSRIFALSFSVFGFEASQSTSLLTVMGDWHDMTLPIACLTLLVLAGYSR